MRGPQRLAQGRYWRVWPARFAFTDGLVNLIAGQSDARSRPLSTRELERLCDDNLVGIVRVLVATKIGAGGVIVGHEEEPRGDQPAD